jgi:hypothetical protein
MQSSFEINSLRHGVSVRAHAQLNKWGYYGVTQKEVFGFFLTPDLHDRAASVKDSGMVCEFGVNPARGRSHGCGLRRQSQPRRAIERPARHEETFAA